MFLHCKAEVVGEFSVYVKKESLNGFVFSLFAPINNFIKVLLNVKNLRAHSVVRLIYSAINYSCRPGSDSHLSFYTHPLNLFMQI